MLSELNYAAWRRFEIYQCCNQYHLSAIYIPYIYSYIYMYLYVYILIYVYIQKHTRTIEETVTVNIQYNYKKAQTQVANMLQQFKIQRWLESFQN